MDIKDERIHMRINGKLKREVQRYCDRRGMDVSDIVTRFFQRIVENEKGRRQPKDV